MARKYQWNQSYCSSKYKRQNTFMYAHKKGWREKARNSPGKRKIENLFSTGSFKVLYYGRDGMRFNNDRDRKECEMIWNVWRLDQTEIGDDDDVSDDYIQNSERRGLRQHLMISSFFTAWVCGFNSKECASREQFTFNLQSTNGKSVTNLDYIAVCLRWVTRYLQKSTKKKRVWYLLLVVVEK